MPTVFTYEIIDADPMETECLDGLAMVLAQMILQARTKKDGNDAAPFSDSL